MLRVTCIAFFVTCCEEGVLYLMYWTTDWQMNCKIKGFMYSDFVLRVSICLLRVARKESYI